MTPTTRSTFGSSSWAASEPVRIAFVIPSLGAGGAERVATLLANEWNANGHDVTLVTFDAPGTEPFFASILAFPSAGSRRPPSRGLSAKLGTNVARVSRLRSVLRELHPDVAVAFMTEANVIALWASRGLGVPVVISERNQPDRPGLGQPIGSPGASTYPLASALVVQTDAIASWARARFRIPVHVIPNPVRLGAGDAPRAGGDVQWIISLGRLAPQKGFDILIESFAAVASKHPKWRLAIYGEGPDRQLLERLRAESGCADRILLPGLTRDPAEAPCAGQASSCCPRASRAIPTPFSRRSPKACRSSPRPALEARWRSLPMGLTACSCRPTMSPP